MTMWITATQEYDFTTKYIKATENKTAYTLCRYATMWAVHHEAEWSNFMVSTMQYEMTPKVMTPFTSFIHKAKHRLKNKSDYKPKENTRYFCQNANIYTPMVGKWNILSRSMLRQLTWWCHGSLAHPCYQSLKRDFICNNMVCWIESVPEMCHISQTAKTPDLGTYIEKKWQGRAIKYWLSGSISSQAKASRDLHWRFLKMWRYAR